METLTIRELALKQGLKYEYVLSVVHAFRLKPVGAKQAGSSRRMVSTYDYREFLAAMQAITAVSGAME